jgi:hypothetical protein
MQSRLRSIRFYPLLIFILLINIEFIYAKNPRVEISLAAKWALPYSDVVRAKVPSPTLSRISFAETLRFGQFMAFLSNLPIHGYSLQAQFLATLQNFVNLDDPLPFDTLMADFLDGISHAKGIKYAKLLKSFEKVLVQDLHFYIPKIIATHDVASQVLEKFIESNSVHQISQLESFLNQFQLQKNCDLWLFPLDSQNFIAQFEKPEDVDLCQVFRNLDSHHAKSQKIMLIGNPLDQTFHDILVKVESLSLLDFLNPVFYLYNPYNFPENGHLNLQQYSYGIKAIRKNTEYNASIFSDSERQQLLVNDSIAAQENEAFLYPLKQYAQNINDKERRLNDFMPLKSFLQIYANFEDHKTSLSNITFSNVAHSTTFVLDDAYDLFPQAASVFQIADFLKQYLFYFQDQDALPAIDPLYLPVFQYEFPKENLISILKGQGGDIYTIIICPDKLSHLETFLYLVQQMGRHVSLLLGFTQTSPLSSYLFELGKNPGMIFRLVQAILQLHEKHNLTGEDLVYSNILSQFNIPKNINNTAKEKIVHVSGHASPLIFVNGRPISRNSFPEKNTITIDRYYDFLEYPQIWNIKPFLQNRSQYLDVNSYFYFVSHSEIASYLPKEETLILDGNSSSFWRSVGLADNMFLINGRIYPMKIIGDNILREAVIKRDRLIEACSITQLLSSYFQQSFNFHELQDFKDFVHPIYRKVTHRSNNLGSCNITLVNPRNPLTADLKGLSIFSYFQDEILLRTELRLADNSDVYPTAFTNYRFVLDAVAELHLKMGILYNFQLVDIPVHWQWQAINAINTLNPKNTDPDNIIFAKGI